MSDSQEPGFKLADSPSHLLHRAQQLAADRFAMLVGENGVTLRQFAVLAAIAETPGLSQADLVRVTGIDRSTLADMMNRMEKRGWVTRTTSASDARAHAVRLAPGGAATYAATLQHAKAADTAILDALSKGRRKAFHATLIRLAKVADDAVEAAEREARKEAKAKARLEAKARERADARAKKLRRRKRAETAQLRRQRLDAAAKNKT